MGESPLVPFDAGKPTVPRLNDYLLGGKDNFVVDREMAAELIKAFPLLAVLARETRDFVARAVGYVAAHGVTQFIDVGCGMPASSSTHEVASQANPRARVAYVDNDPVVISHMAALVARPGQVAAVPGDVRCPADILAEPRLTELIDTSEPFCLVMSIILDFIPPKQAAGIMAEFRDAMPTGSFLALCVGTNDAPDIARDYMRVHHDVARIHMHSREQIAGYLAGLEIVEPGLIEARHWRPTLQLATETAPRQADALAIVGRKA
jgi:O-methyltransferase involved in polyketide biosynthesis